MSMLFQASEMRKSFLIGGKDIPVLKGVNFSVNQGEFISIMGTSGSGKSTLLHVLGCLDIPDSGGYTFNGKNMLELSDIHRSWIRANWIGFVFQTFDLLSEFDVVENVSLPFLYNEVDPGLKEELVMRSVEMVGLSHRKNHRPMELSGGEMQRVAIARALAIDPKLILADEPTGNLDSKNSAEILSLFRKLNHSGTTIVMVTHDKKVAACSERILIMEDGYLR